MRTPHLGSAWKLFLAVPLALTLALAILSGPAEARTVTVNCGHRHTIGHALKSSVKHLAIIVKGACVENVEIERDDVTITTDGVTPASITAADASKPVITLDGAQRIVIDGLLAGGLTLSGGTFGVSASRTSTLDLQNCTVSGNSANGVVASYGSTVGIDSCTVGPNMGNGVVAANTSSVAITNSTVSNNTAAGILAIRSSYVRVGQDLAGTTTVKPVNVSASGGNGIAITESSSGNVVGGVVDGSVSTNIFVGRGSSGQIGLGSNNLMGGVVIQNGARHGVSVEGGNATIVFSAISGNGLTGITVSNAGSARIGILNTSTGYGPTTVSNNGQVGIQVAIGGAAFVGGTTISGNGNGGGGGAFGRFGISVVQGSATLAGDNVIANNGESGIFVGRGGSINVGDGAFGLTTTNTISGNGSVGPNNGGLFAFQGGIIQVFNGAISGNTGPAVQSFEAGVIELRGSTAVTVPAAGSTAGAVVQFGATLRVRDTASIVSGTGDGIQASNMTAVNIRDGNTIQGNGAGSVGIRCFNVSSTAPASAATLNGNLARVSGTAGATTGCNVFP